MKLNHDDFNYYGFDIKKVCEKIEGDLTYLGTFCIFGNYKPVAVFSNANPNLEKGHKPYCYLIENKGQIMIGGINEEQMEKERYQSGLYCQHCKNVIYSVNRHDYRYCKCSDEKKQITVDGGKDDFQFSWGKEASYEYVKIDFKTGQIETVSDIKD